MKCGKMMIIKTTNTLDQQRKTEFYVMPQWIKLDIMFLFCISTPNVPIVYAHMFMEAYNH